MYGGQQEVIKWSGERCEARIRGIVSNGKRMVVVVVGGVPKQQCRKILNSQTH